MLVTGTQKHCNDLRQSLTLGANPAVAQPPLALSGPSPHLKVST